MVSRAPSRGPLIGLLVASVVSAGILAFFASRERDAAQVTLSSSADAADAGEAEARPRATEPAPTAESRATAPRGAAQPLEANEVLPADPLELESHRLADVEVEPQIRDRGVQALLTPLRCVPPSRAMEIRPSGPGGAGCLIEQDEGLPLYVGRWVVRNGAGLLEVGNYESGLRVGPWTQYHPNGFKAAEGEFVDDKRDGVWNEWDENGKFFARRRYKDGLLHGVAVVFQGMTPRAELWTNGRREGEDDFPEASAERPLR